MHTLTEGLESTELKAVFEDIDGTLWAAGGPDLATWDPDASRFETRRGPRRSATEFPIVTEPISMLRDSSGTLWVGTQRGLYSETADGWEGPHGPPPMRWAIRALFEDSEGELWVGTNQGLFRRGRGVEPWIRWTHAILQDRKIRVIQESPKGTLWLGTQGSGLVRFQAGEFLALDQNRGLPSDLVSALWQAPGGDLWIGTENRGLIRLDPTTVDNPEGPTFSVIGKTQGLWSNGIHQILDDGLGFLWMSSNQGIFRVEIQALEGLADGTLERIESVAFTERDGMADRAGSRGLQQTGLRDRHGVLWFPTADGMVQIDPAKIEISTAPPAVHVQSVEAGGETLGANSGSLELAPHQRSFTVTFSAPSFRAPERLRFRYRLVPYEMDWVEAGSSREARYTKVPPGDYRFEVAVNEDGLWSLRPGTLPVIVEARFYETRAFLAGLIIAAFMTLAAGVRWREARARAQQRALERQVADRTATIARQTEQLRQLDRLKSEFFANISHELRTPLTLMLGPLRDALAGVFGPLGERLKAPIDLAARQAASQLGLVEQLLDVAKLDAGALDLRRRSVDLTGLVGQRIEAFLFLADQRNIELSLQLPAKPVEAFVDPTEMAKVIDNLLSNALKFTPEEGRVRVSVRDSNGATIVVSDSGPGVSPDQQSLVFDRFHRADSSGRQPGTGLGLSLARQIVEMHEGRLELVPEPASADQPEIGGESFRGATFVVSLPRHQAQPDLNDQDNGEVANADASLPVAAETTVPTAAPTTVPAAAARLLTVDIDFSSAAVEAPASETRGKSEDTPTILVVDDNAEIRAYVRLHLEPIYWVLEAVDGEQALETARRRTPDLVISDIMMPRVDGLGLLRALRDDPELECVPVILLTAKASTESHLQGLRQGVDDYLTKPFDGGVLRARVDNMLASRRRLLERLGAPGRRLSLPEIEATPADQALLDRLHEILQQRLGDPELNVAELTRELSCSRAYLTKKVRRLTGETPGAWIRSCRLERASQLLEAEAGSVGEVAYAVGFKSLAHFSNAFVQRFGERPSAVVGRRRRA